MAYWIQYIVCVLSASTEKEVLAVTRIHRFLSLVLCLLLLMTLLPLPLAGAASSTYQGRTYNTDYTKWRQADPAWGQTALGDLHTLSGSGCLVSSIAILMCYSGAYDPAYLNPGTLRDWFDAKEMISHSATRSKDALLSFGMMTSSVSPRFYYVNQEFFDVSTPMADVCAKINYYRNNGYQVVARVKNSGHFVAVASAADSDARIYDPGASSKTNLSEYMGTIGGLLIFKANLSGKDGVMTQFTPPSAPAVNKLSPVYGTGDRVVVSWKAAAKATHYNIYVDLKKADGTWQGNYKTYSYVKSPAAIEALPAGNYRLRVQSGNASTSPWTYANSDYQEFSVQSNSLTVTFDPNGGSVAPASTLMKQFAAFELPTPVRDRYAFIGWYAPSGALITRSSKAGSLGITLTARWAGSGLGFKKTAVYNNNFKDVAKSFWYYDSVASVFEYGLMNGTTAATFAPDERVTAAQAIALSSRMRKLYITGNGTFAATDPWFSSYLDYAMTQKLITAPPEDPDQALTRLEFVGILSNALPSDALPAVNEVPNNAIPDVDQSFTYVYKLYRAGILSGSNSRGAFRPYDPITRAEAATILVRMADPNSRAVFSLT